MRQGIRNLGLALFVFLILMLTGSLAWAVDEAQLTASSEKVVDAWAKLLSQNVDLVSYYRNGYWSIRRHKLIPGSMSYDIKKTDSIVSPYMLIVSFSTSFMDNGLSPNANGYFDKSLRKWFGFSSAEEAFAKTKLEDFPPDFRGKVGGDLDLSVRYAYQKGVWVLKGGNDWFGFNFVQHLTSKENGHYFKDLLAIPAE